MTQQNRRNYFRINDSLYLEVQPIDDAQLNRDIHELFPLTNQQESLLRIQSLTDDSSRLLHKIAEIDRNIAAYLHVVDKKVQVLADMVAADPGLAGGHQPQRVNLSEGGLSYESELAMAIRSHVALKLTLQPSYVALPLYAKVVSCRPIEHNQYAIGLAFKNISEQKQQIIARHVIYKQSMQLRSQRFD